MSDLASTKGAMPAGSADDAEVDRVLKDVPPIPRFPFPKEKLFGPKGVNLPDLRTHFLREGRLDKNDAITLIRLAREVLAKEPTLLELKDPISVCGDLHGQFYDLVRLIEVAGDPKDMQYVFLGDYVDRGCFSCEVVFYLFALKITYPKTFFLLRGNHECRHLTSFFNFKDECLFKYDLEIYEELMNAFDALPLSATVNGKFLCMHGGLSPELKKISDIKKIERFREIPREGPMCDLLWSDPFDKHQGEDGGSRDDTPDDDEDIEEVLGFKPNDTRQCSYVFGKEAVKTFLEKNGLIAVIRAHEAQYEGYKMHMKNTDGVPQVITIFSAPNYCDVYGNKGACIVFNNEVLNIRQFLHSDHPYYLPNFMDIFTWSMPFVAEKVMDVLVNVLDMEKVLEDDEPADKPAVGKEKALNLKKKVLALNKMMKMYKVLRQENEAILQLKQLSPNKKIPLGLLAEGSDAIKKAVSNFKEAQKADKGSEAMPPPTPEEVKEVKSST